MADYRDDTLDQGIPKTGAAARYLAAIALGAAEGADRNDPAAVADLDTALRMVGIEHDELRAANHG